MKKIIGIILIATPLVFSGFIKGSVRTPVRVFAQEVEETTSEVTTEETETSSQDVIEQEEDEVAQTATNSSITLEDTNGDGIPDVIEDYYNTKIRDTYMFGISLGSLISLTMTLAFLFYNSKYGKKANEKLQNLSNDTKVKLKDYSSKVDELTTRTDTAIVKCEESIKQLNEKEILNQERFEEAMKVLEEYKKTSNEVHAILMSLQAMANTEEATMNGVNEEVNKIIQEVK